MWTICRVDVDPHTLEVSHFEIQAAYRKRDLDMKVAEKSGFVGPDDDLILIGPDGKVRN